MAERESDPRERDVDFLARLRSGDEAAFERLYREHFRRVYGYLQLALADRHEAEDATQEVFASVLEALPRYRDTGAPIGAWIRRIARNQAIDVLARARPLYVEEIGALKDALEGGAASLEQLVIARASDEELLAAISRLAPLQRRVLVMRYFLDLDWPEIARALGRSLDAAHQAHRRASHALRPRFSGRVGSSVP